jgi:pimeloyl-ACP methyl ester carboxylesterase
VDDSASQSLGLFKSTTAKAGYMAAYDAVLGIWPVAYEELDVPTRYGATHVIASGPIGAPPLVLLSGFFCTATAWRPNVEVFSRHFRVYAVDVIGQPGKSIAHRRIKSRREFSDWLTDLLDALHVHRADLVGNSFGGFLAMNQASLTPERVHRVVLISPAGVFMPYGRWKHVLLTLRDLVRRCLPGAQRPNSMSIWFGRDVVFDQSDAKWVALVEKALSVVKITKISALFPREFPPAELAAIRAPTLLLIGEYERLYEPRAALRRAGQLMPGIDGRVVPQAHHIASLAKPAEVNAQIVRFLQSPGGHQARC